MFCCFNNNHKILPDVFLAWVRILKEVPGSVLWLYSASEAAERTIRGSAETAGLAPERIVFARHVPYADYLARLRLTDLFLDTSPYNAGTTASDALWMGLPVLTRLGEAFAGRMAANRGTAQLFDAVRFARNIEAAYMAMAERHWAGLTPDHIRSAG